MFEKPSDVVVVGGGVIGLSVAYACARDGLRVTLLERGGLGQEASWAGAGILPPGHHASARSPYAALLGMSSEMYAELSDELRERTGIDNGYRRCGGLEIGFDDEDAHALRSAAGHHAKQGVLWQELTPGEARELEPALLGPFQVAYHVPGMAQLRNPRHLKALAAVCAQHAAQLVTGAAVAGFEVEQDRVVGVRTSAGRCAAETTVVTAGAWSGGLLESLGVTLPVRPIRGQIALLATDTPQIQRVVMMGKRYLVPRPDGRVLAGSTEEDVGFDKRPTCDGIRGLLDMAAEIAPVLAQARIERTWAGLRPGSADSRPYIGPVPGYRGILVATGHFRSGLQLAPATGLLVRQLIAGDPPAVPLDAFRIDRPAARWSCDAGLDFSRI